MATGTPVVTNSKVLASLSVTPGRDLLVGDTADTFAACVMRLMNDTMLANAVGQAGNQYVKNNHNWKKNAQQMVDIYTGLKSPAGYRI